MKRLTLVFAILLLALSPVAAVAEGGSTDWLMTVSFRYEKTSLDVFLQRLSASFHFAYFVDRRVDPEMMINDTRKDEYLYRAMGECMVKHGLSCCVIGSLLYVGPPDAAGQFMLANALMRERIARTPNARRLAQNTSLDGKQFCQPRALLDRLADTAAMRWTGLDRMPFDCWNEFAVPPLTVAEQIQLVLVGFGVRFDFDETTGVLKPVALNSGEVTRSYAVSAIGDLDREAWPECRFEKGKRNDEETISVTGPFAQLAKLEYTIARAARPEAARRGGAKQGARSRSRATTVASGTAQNKPLGDLFSSLGDAFDVSMTLADSFESAGVTLKTLITCRFDNATLRQICNMIADKIGARYRQDGRNIVFEPK